jgi:branched-chain amino acid transport system ATP-binding protein
MLEIEGLNTFYGDSHILQVISFYVREGEVATLLGRNGMGKTTTIKSIMGLIRPRAGRILFKGKDIVGLKPHEIAQRGIGFVPDDRRIFPSLTVLENLNLPARKKGEGGWQLESIYEFFPILRDRSKHRGFELSGGEQQMLAIARALRMRTELMLLDEPSEGLAPSLIRAIETILQEIKRAGITILLVEQNTGFATRVADRHYILSHGKIVYEGDNDDFMRRGEVKKQYLGI